MLAPRWSCFVGFVILSRDEGVLYVVLVDDVVGIIVLAGAGASCVKNAEVDVGLTLWLIVRRIGGACIGEDNVEAGALVVKTLAREVGGRAPDCDDSC